MVEEGGGGSECNTVKMGKGKPPRDTASVFVLFPVDNEDAFSILRRPAIVASVSKHIVFLTSRIVYNPFNFLSLSCYDTAKKPGVTIVFCARMDFAIFTVRDGMRWRFGACGISITGKDGHVQGLGMAIDSWGCLSGRLFASLKITQLALDANTVHV